MTVLFNNNQEKIIPVVAIRQGVIFPHAEMTLTFGRSKSLAAIKAAFKSNRLICLFTQKDSRVHDPDIDDLYRIGTVARIEDVLEDKKLKHALIRGLVKVRLESLQTKEPFLIGSVSEVNDIAEDSSEVKALYKNLLNDFQRAINLGKSVDARVIIRLMSGVNPAELADQVAYVLDLETDKKQKLLELTDVRLRLEKVTEYLSHEIKVLDLEKAIASKTQKKFDKTMREAILRERKKTIEEELGEISEEDTEMKEYEVKIKKAKMPKEVKEKAKQELKRLSKLNPNHPEVGYIRTYLDWLTEMPWAKSSPNKHSITKAAKVLEEDHYGLKKAKERVVEYLAVMKLKEKNKKHPKKGRKKEEEIGGPTILCFIGPPGVGKTSIGRSIARSLGRKFVRMSLGGTRDEAEIRGHRRTYVGAMPGRIIQGIKNASTNNPVFMLDEIDKVGIDFRGDPSAALLEALDPEQNYEFSDNYLEVPFDLSKVMFITTGNILDTIPPALRDRMEIIRFPGYTEEEKFNIAKKFLWQKQLRANGLDKKKIKLADSALSEVINRYTREAGVRELERNLATICRKIARKEAEKKRVKGTVIKADVVKHLGPRKYSETMIEKEDQIGMATGLAYTQAGGDIILIEVALMPGKGRLLLTGKLGKVMKESGKAALSYVRSRWQPLQLREDFYKEIDTHVHIPEGAVPKDGPSAGVAITAALVSAFTKIPVRRDVGMTGEITLRGRVLEVGGIKEKVIAAHRAGLKTVVLPKDNKKDLEEIPTKVKKDIKFKFAEHMDEVLGIVLKTKTTRKRPKKITRNIPSRTVSLAS
ncbi:MAG TPA: endopeptidase La [Patescibacteria group bacterium]|nr:endopeptidase La [Patescibacteria group bacterium]